MTVPVVEKKITVNLPPCPIKAGTLAPTAKTFTLPAKSPTPVGVSAKGTATATDDSGATIASVKIEAKIGPDMAESPQAMFIMGPQEPDWNAIADMVASIVGGTVTDVSDAAAEKKEAGTPFWMKFKKMLMPGPILGGGKGFDWAKFVKKN